MQLGASLKLAILILSNTRRSKLLLNHMGNDMVMIHGGWGGQTFGMALLCIGVFVRAPHILFSDRLCT